jgi:hypothetical protein
MDAVVRRAVGALPAPDPDEADDYVVRVDRDRVPLLWVSRKFEPLPVQCLV